MLHASYNHFNLLLFFITSYVLCLACIFQEVDNGYNLYVPEGTITVRDSDLYLYDPNGALISINYMLQQLYPYMHAYLSLYLVTYADNQAYYILIHVQAMHISYTWIMSITCIHMRYFQTVFLYTYTITITSIVKPENILIF